MGTLGCLIPFCSVFLFPFWFGFPFGFAVFPLCFGFPLQLIVALSRSLQTPALTYPILGVSSPLWVSVMNAPQNSTNWEHFCVSAADVCPLVTAARRALCVTAFSLGVTPEIPRIHIFHRSPPRGAALSWWVEMPLSHWEADDFSGCRDGKGMGLRAQRSLKQQNNVVCEFTSA